MTALEVLRTELLVTEPANGRMVIHVPPAGLRHAVVFLRDDALALELEGTSRTNPTPIDRWFALDEMEAGEPDYDGRSWVSLTAHVSEERGVLRLLHLQEPQPLPPNPPAAVFAAGHRAAQQCTAHTGLSGRVHAAVESTWRYATGRAS